MSLVPCFDAYQKSRVPRRPFLPNLISGTALAPAHGDDAAAAAGPRRRNSKYKQFIVEKIIDAARRGALQELDELLSANKKLINATGSHDMAALHHACMENQLGSVKLLLKYKADCYLHDERRWTCLHIAASENYEDIVAELLQQKYIELDARNEDENTPLHYLARYPSLGKFLPIFLKRNVDINALNTFAETPLHMAVLKGTPATVELLLQNGADLTIKNNKDETPKDWAVRIGNPELIALMKKYEQQAASTLAIPGSSHKNPQKVNSLLNAIAEDQFEVVRDMIKADKKLLETCETQVKHPLLVAAEHNRTRIHKLLLQACTHVPKYVLLRTLSLGKDECALALLLSHHFRTVSKLEDGALHVVAEMASTHCELLVFALVEHGVDINAINGGGDTPLHIATRLGRITAIQLLLDLGANRAKPNNNHETPVDLAQRSGNQEVLEAFELVPRSTPTPTPTPTPCGDTAQLLPVSPAPPTTTTPPPAAAISLPAVSPPLSATTPPSVRASGELASLGAQTEELLSRLQNVVEFIGTVKKNNSVSGWQRMLAIKELLDKALGETNLSTHARALKKILESLDPASTVSFTADYKAVEILNECATRIAYVKSSHPV
eukprot:TRINITY_DN5189_c0_g1_i1.p1 TRINITY_DN5189_c0_g1~~TRINITY_DN5189_c0_g1_i1.p1  ORF type:complete len:612 (+),score=163.52 TRINITY_DN5189_c0_g1_i1:1118-2953(+)